ncbi:uncharacterized protein [Dermacentor albipictus]|uniref:uncharacterized protein n=1 Tax=Dermacentor albipictus TaxID=60249 RepID=UPI0038FCCAC5
MVTAVHLAKDVHILYDARLKGDVESATKSISTDLKVDGMGSRLTHLLEAKAALLGRWKGQLPNRTLCDADYPCYRGLEREDLDTPFSKNKVREALFNLNGRSAPGLDGILNRLLRNLGEKSIATLMDETNRVWYSRDTPDDWKLALEVLIPKPSHGTRLGTSRYIEECELFPYNTAGFRPFLSTRVVMKLTKHHIIVGDTQDLRGILALDLEKAFDNISHRHISDSVSVMGLGFKFHGGRSSRYFSSTSPCAASPLISKVDGVNHTLYADDITVWCDGSSEGRVEESLQVALGCTEEFLAGTGLRLSPSKSELLLYRPTRRGHIPKGQLPHRKVDISIRTTIGQVIPKVKVIRILSMLIEANGSNRQTIARIATKTDNIVRLITRVSNSRRGLGEDNLVRWCHSFLMSHTTYVAAALCWHGYKRAKLEVLMRKSIKKLLGIPKGASTEKLMQLGVHKTLDEVVEAQQTAHGHVS